MKNNRFGKSLGGGTIIGYSLFGHIVSPQNIFAAWREFQSGKMKKKDVLEFSERAEYHLLELQGDLKNGKYRHGQYSRFFVCDPKRREISKASVRDRVLHHAICRILTPIFEPKFIFDSYSSRAGKGTLAAIERFEQFARKLSLNNTRTVWVLKCDVRKFFDSVDHKILLGLLEKNISCPRSLDLLREVIRSFSSKSDKGIPLGNLTSQLFSNVYLDPLDQFVKRVLRVKYYIRYADDIFVLDSDREYLVHIFGEMDIFLSDRLELQFHEKKISMQKWHEGVDVLGYISFPHHRVLRTKTKRRMFWKIAHAKEHMPEKKFVSVLASYLGRLKHCSGHGLEQKIDALSGKGADAIITNERKAKIYFHFSRVL